ncbi:MAG: hypothetical protein Q7U97_09075 [Rhodocyclaceae bacterium]|nr:hypothetical protein [Rhodocyclaceae bacterium]
MATIPDFTDVERKLVSQALLERFGQPIPIESADAEIQLGISPAELTLCPVLHWEARDANFVIMKVAVGRYRCLFYYTAVEQFGTGRDEYDNLGDCVITLLQVQSDHERSRAGIKSGMNSFTVTKPDDYDGPLVI